MFIRYSVIFPWHEPAVVISLHELLHTIYSSKIYLVSPHPSINGTILRRNPVRIGSKELRYLRLASVLFSYFVNYSFPHPLFFAISFALSVLVSYLLGQDIVQEQLLSYWTWNIEVFEKVFCFRARSTFVLLTPLS